MKKIFIDVGAYDGDTVKQFFNWGNLVDDPNNYTIYALEPNPDMKKQLLDVESQYENVTYIPKAAWVEDGTIQFAVDKTPTPLGSTAMSSKTNIWDVFDKVDVEAIDFSNWLKQFKNDYVVVKMDIEGAEFPVLNKLLDDGTIDIIDHLWVELHPNKVKDFTTTDKEELVKKLKQHTNFKEWH